VHHKSIRSKNQVIKQSQYDLGVYLPYKMSKFFTKPEKPGEETKARRLKDRSTAKPAKVKLRFEYNIAKGKCK